MPEFFEKLQSIRDFIKTHKLKVTFHHVKREHNSFADYMGRLATSLQRDVYLEDVDARWNQKLVLPELVAAYTPYQGEREEFLSTNCYICNETTTLTDALTCDICSDCAHLRCLHLDTVPRGFWYCESCLVKIHNHKYRDITVDLDLMHYVYHNSHSTSCPI